MGFTVVTVRPASMAPNVAIGYSGKLGKQTASTSGLKSLNWVWRRTAKAALASRIWANVYWRSVMTHTWKIPKN